MKTTQVERQATKVVIAVIGVMVLTLSIFFIFANHVITVI